MPDASVRELIQRGTLTSERDAQGRTYVFLDFDQFVPKWPKTRTGRPAAGQPKVLESLVAMSTILAAFAAGVYVLGLLVLWAPIARYESYSWTAAWYAASLAPRTVVAGHGLTPLLAPAALSFYALLVVCIFNTARLANNRVEKWGKKVALGVGWLGIFFFTLFAVSFGLLVVRFLYPLIDTAFSILGLYTESALRFFPVLPELIVIILTAGFFGLAVTLLIAGGYYLFSGVYNSFDTTGVHFVPRVTDWGGFTRALAIYFAFIFVVAFMWSLTIAKSHLPSVEITTKTKITESGYKTFDARLLAHTDGFWYVLNEQKLLTIPDGNVRRVRMPSERGAANLEGAYLRDAKVQGDSSSTL
jgi:hypothetical protein